MAAGAAVLGTRDRDRGSSRRGGFRFHATRARGEFVVYRAREYAINRGDEAVRDDVWGGVRPSKARRRASIAEARALSVGGSATIESGILETNYARGFSRTSCGGNC